MLRAMDETRLRNIIIVSVTAVVAVAMVALFWILRESDKATISASTKFATALVRNDPGAAPEGGAAYVKGVRARFGPVTSARVIDSHNHSVNTGDSADTRSYYVGDVLLRTERGPAVLELSFDNQSLANHSQKISGVHELEPDQVRRHKLDKAERADLEAAFAARGGNAADDMALSGVLADLPKPGSVPRDDHLSCIQRAHGDVQKMLRCG
jgi:hypothetical protein